MNPECSNILLVEDEEAHAELTKLKRIPIIMLTTSEQERDIARCYDHHANSYLTKPVGYKEFEERIREIRAYWVLINKPPVLEGQACCNARGVGLRG